MPLDLTAPVEWSAHESWGRVPLLDLAGADPGYDRLMVVAAHPDDESLGAGGLIASAHRAGIGVYLLLLTAGEAADPAVAGGSHHELARMRLHEMECAVECLAPGTPVVFLGAQDGQVAECEDKIAAVLTEMLGPGSRTLLAAPWSNDGHPDHEAAGRAARTAAAASGARLVEYPVRLWLDRGPEQAPWPDMVRLDLDDERRGAKREAIACHLSQMRQRDGGSRSLAHLTGESEHYVVTPVSAAAPSPVPGRPASDCDAPDHPAPLS